MWGDVQGSLLAVEYTSVSVVALSTPYLVVTVPFGAERQAALALLWDCRVRYVSLDVVPVASLP